MIRESREERAKQAKTRQPCRPIPCRAANLGLFLDQRLTEELVPRERPLVTFASRFLRTVRGQVPVLCRASRPGATSEHDDSHRQFLVGHPSMEGWVDVIDIQIFHSPTDDGPWTLTVVGDDSALVSCHEDWRHDTDGQQYDVDNLAIRFI